MDEDAKLKRIEEELTSQGALLKEIHTSLVGQPMQGKPGLIQNQQEIMHDYYGGEHTKGTKDKVEELGNFKAKVMLIFSTLTVVAIIIGRLVDWWVLGWKK